MKYKTSVNITIIGEKTKFSGDIRNGNIRIDGIVYGCCERSDSLIISPGGTMVGDIYSENVTVAGHVKGDIYSNKVTLLATANVEGNIIANVFSVESNAIFNGKCIMG